MEETTVQGRGFPVLAAEGNGRVGFPRQRTSNNPMLTTECQDEEHSHATDTPTFREDEYKSEGEGFSHRVSITADARSKTPQKDKSATLMECEADKIALADAATHGDSRSLSYLSIIITDTQNTARGYLNAYKGPSNKLLTTSKQDRTLCVQ